MTGTGIVTESIVVAAAPEQVFALLADPRAHPLFDGSGTLRAVVSGPARLSPGARFGMRMRMGLPYQVVNTVREFEDARRIAWSHFGGHRWRYELEPVDGGTRVTESWDMSRLHPLVQHGMTLVGFPTRNRRGMAASLIRLKTLAETA